VLHPTSLHAAPRSPRLGSREARLRSREAGPIAPISGARAYDAKLLHLALRVSASAGAAIQLDDDVPDRDRDDLARNAAFFKKP
jgi:hypothetical protein